MRTLKTSRSGFTLAEAAITIAIVGLCLTYSVQALRSATITAANTQQRKIARELAIRTLGDIASGQWWDEIELERQGSYADLDYPNYSWELAVGDDEFPTPEDWEEGDDYMPFDSLQHKQELQDDRDRDAGIEEDDEAVEPYERLRIKVGYPSLPGVEADNYVILERWIPWIQVYGPDEEEAVPDGALSDDELPGGIGDASAPNTGR